MPQETKKALAASLKRLLCQKPLNKITIRDITDDCGINRMTFYYHFKDIYDLLSWLTIQEATQALKNNKTEETWQQGFISLFYIALKNKVLVHNILHSVSLEQVEIYLYRVTYSLIYDVVEEKAANMNIREEDKKFVTEFYTYAFVGIVQNWSRNGMKEDPEKIVRRLSLLMRGEITRAINVYQQDKMQENKDF